MDSDRIKELQEQLRIANVSNNEIALKYFVEEFVEAWEDGIGGDINLYRKAKSLSYTINKNLKTNNEKHTRK